jgi:hypothetical protein
MKRIFYTLLIIHCFLLIVVAQPVQQEWIRRYPDSLGGNGGGRAITMDNNGSVYVTGPVTLNNHMNYCTIKYLANGNVKWINLYPGNNTGGRQPYAIAVDRSLNVFVTGYGYQTGNYFDYLTIKYDSLGNEEWVRFYNGQANDIDQATSIAIDNTGNIYVTGYSSEGGNSFVYCTIKYNTNGDSVWVRKFGQPSASAGANGIAIDERCNVYITGMSNDHAITVSYDSSGNLRWSQVYYGTFGSEAKALALDKDDNVFVTGQSAENNGYQYFTAKYTSVGEQKWVKLYTYCNGCDNFAQLITVDRSNNVYVCGRSANNQTNTFGFATIKYSNDGDSIWVRRNEVINISPCCMAITRDLEDNIYITASVADTECGTWHYFTFQYDSSGVLKWKICYNVNYIVYTYSDGIIVDNLGNVYVTGGAGAVGYSNQVDMCTIKYSQPLYGIKRISDKVPQRFVLFQNYPNPFNPVTIINYELPKVGYVKLIIYDIIGKEVATIVNQKQNPGKYQVTWDASNFSSGVYFYSLEYNGGIMTKKLVLLK